MQVKYLIYLFFLLFGIRCFAVDIKSEPIKPLPAIEISDPDLVRLGEQLFQDPRLSADGTVSCATCHILSHAGVDGLPVSYGVNGRMGQINTPTVYNSSLNFRQFWNGRALTLEEQVDGPLNNHLEMAFGWDQVLNLVMRDANYANSFKQLFVDGVTILNIKKALSCFEQSLSTPNSRFDRYLSGDESVLTREEVHGYQLFKNYGCVSCHQGVGIGGNMFQKLGVMKPYFVEGKYSEVDLGRFNITHKESDRHVFKVPSLRNVALTAPYLHTGKVKTLKDVVKVMMTYQLGITAPEKDVDSIILFLKTLTGEYQGKSL